jgi:ribulose-phosphate 3-epimerase
MGKTRVKLAPSILAADFARLGEQVDEAERAGADRIHVDVMDGHFVPNLSMGAVVVKSVRRVTRLPLEAHLMISDPDLFVDEFAQAAIDAAVPVPVLSTALYERFSSRGEATFGDKLLSAMRYEFGGHVEKAAG